MDPPPPTPCSEIIYIWRLFGARVDVNLNLQNAQKQTVFSTHIFKKSPLWEGYTPGGGGELYFHVNGGGVPLWVENLTLSQCARCTKKYTLHVTIIDTLLKMFIMHTLSQYCTVACARSRACHKHCGLEALGSNPVINGVVRQ